MYPRGHLFVFAHRDTQVELGTRRQGVRKGRDAAEHGTELPVHDLHALMLFRPEDFAFVRTVIQLETD